MVSDMEARNAVRRLVQRLEAIAAQGSAMAYVLARRDITEYARLLEAADVAERIVIQPIVDAEGERHEVYAALDDPNVDWTGAVIAMLERGPVVFSADEALARARFTQTLDERFDAKMREKSGNRENKGL
jgi:hypothetical protein